MESCLKIIHQSVIIKLFSLITASVQTQQIYTCSKLILGTLEKLWNMYKVNYKDIRMTPFFVVIDVNFEHISHFSTVSIVDFEQVDVSSEIYLP